MNLNRIIEIVLINIIRLNKLPVNQYINYEININKKVPQFPK